MLFADDLKLLREMKSPEHAQLYGFALYLVSRKFLVIPNSKEAPGKIYTIDCTPHPVADKVKDLGVLVQNYISTSRERVEVAATGEVKL